MQNMKMKLSQDSTLHQGTMNCKVAETFEQVHWVQGPEIMTLWLQDVDLWLGFSFDRHIAHKRAGTRKQREI